MCVPLVRNLAPPPCKSNVLVEVRVSGLVQPLKKRPRLVSTEEEEEDAYMEKELGDDKDTSAVLQQSDVVEVVLKEQNHALL